MMTDIEWFKVEIADELKEFENDLDPAETDEEKGWNKGYTSGLRFALWVLNGSPHGN